MAKFTFPVVTVELSQEELKVIESALRFALADNLKNSVSDDVLIARILEDLEGK